MSHHRAGERVEGKWKVNILTFSLLLVCVLGSACSAPHTPAPEPVTLTIATAEVCEPLMTDLVEEYQAERPFVSFSLKRATSAAALDAVLAGEADLAAVGQISTTEVVWLTAVAIDNIAVVVHPSNPVKDLTLLQLRDIFRGRDASWSAVGGLPANITVVTRERGSETRADFESRVLEGRPVTLAALVAPSPQAVIDAVSTLTNSIGYVSIGDRPAGVKMIAVEGVLPTPLTAANRTYPIQRVFYFVALQEPDPLTQGALRDFVAWVLGPAGQLVVAQRYGRVR